MRLPVFVTAAAVVFECSFVFGGLRADLRLVQPRRRLHVGLDVIDRAAERDLQRAGASVDLAQQQTALEGDDQVERERVGVGVGGEQLAFA